MALFNRGCEWLERKNFISVRALMLYATVWLTWEAFLRMTAYALVSKLDGIGTAAVIAAITAPVTAWAGFVYKFYSDSRSDK